MRGAPVLGAPRCLCAVSPRSLSKVGERLVYELV